MVKLDWIGFSLVMGFAFIRGKKNDKGIFCGFLRYCST